MIHLKHLGPITHQYLTHVFSLSLSPSNILSIWKQGRVIPLLKPRKSVNDIKSYRPVSILFPASKILEKCILPILQHYLKCAPNQHGFSSRHSTVTELNELATAIANGFNQRQPADRTLLVALDLSKAFNTMWHSTLLTLLNSSSLPGALVRWLSTYMHGRQAQTFFGDSLSKNSNRSLRSVSRVSAWTNFVQFLRQRRSLSPIEHQIGFLG